MDIFQIIQIVMLMVIQTVSPPLYFFASGTKTKRTLIMIQTDLVMVVTVVMMDASWTLCTGPEKKLDLLCTMQQLKYCHYPQHESPQNSPKVLMRKGKGKRQSWQNPRINNQNQKRPKHIKKNSVKFKFFLVLLVKQPRSDGRVCWSQNRKRANATG